MNKILLLTLLWSSSVLALNAEDNVFYPKNRDIEVKNITQDIIHVLPGRSVKIIFPWVISESGDLEHDITLSSDAVFQYAYKEGQNFINVTYKNISPDFEGEVADLSLTSKGYHFNFLIKADFNPVNHYTAVVVNLSKAKRLEMIDREIRAVKKSFAIQKADMERGLDKRAEKKALNILGNLADRKPNIDGIKEEVEHVDDKGNEIIVYVDKVLRWKKFNLFKVEIDNRGGKEFLAVNSLTIGAKTASGVPETLIYEYSSPKRVEAGEIEIATISVLGDIADKYEEYTINVATSAGEIKVDF